MRAPNSTELWQKNVGRNIRTKFIFLPPSFCLFFFHAFLRRGRFGVPVMAETSGQKNQKVIHFSASVFLPVPPARFRIWSLGFHWSLVFGAWCFFSGCSFAPKYQPPAVQIPPAFKELLPQNPDATNLWKVAKPSDAALRGK